MKKSFKSIIALLAAAACLTVSGFAANSSVTFEGGAENFVFLPGSGYSDTDLFNGFKNVMPGDTVTQTITVKNSSDEYDSVKIYLRAEVENPLSYDEVYEGRDGKDQEAGEGMRDETVVTMSDFLSKLSMKVSQGEGVLFEASPNELGGLKDGVQLGEFDEGESTEILVELQVPIELSNKYANRVGEVDWVFTVEGIIDDPDDPDDPGGGGGDDPDPPPIDIPDDPVPSDPGDPPVDIPEEEPPLAELPQTGLLQWPIPVMAVIGVLLMMIGIVSEKRRKNQME